MSKRISRRTLMQIAAGTMAAAASGTFWMTKFGERKIPCRMLGPSKSIGHRLRKSESPAAETTGLAATQSKKVVIVGGGIAGLSAAWWLKRNGITDFILLELEKHVGGNSSSGRNLYSSYPWGAHYIPLANSESTYVRMLFQELGIITSIDASGLATYDELCLCHDPQERLYKDGAFQEGLIPKRGLQQADKDEMKRFFDQIASLRNARGRDGKPAFAIPLDLSSQDAEFRDLDNISMAQWMEQNGFKTKPLRWYLNYCCRDDYGSTLENVSAWAGLHYFAGRRGFAANAEANAVVTWPEGNGYLVNSLREKIEDCILTKALVTDVSSKTDSSSKTTVTYVDTDTNKNVKIEADFVIIASPRFIARHIVADLRTACDHLKQSNDNQSYAPWMVANISVSAVPSADGEDLSWDNVSYYSKSLGYVVASHQLVETYRHPTVLTYYFPLSDLEPQQGRRELFNADPEKWSALIVADLEKMHPGIAEKIESIDLWPWAHGMIRPSVGYIWGDSRTQMKKPQGNIFFAHSDMSGISNFEEAQYQGVEAAKRILAKLEINPALEDVNSSAEAES